MNCAQQSHKIESRNLMLSGKQERERPKKRDHQICTLAINKQTQLLDFVERGTTQEKEGPCTRSPNNFTNSLFCINCVFFFLLLLLTMFLFVCFYLFDWYSCVCWHRSWNLRRTFKRIRLITSND